MSLHLMVTALPSFSSLLIDWRQGLCLISTYHLFRDSLGCWTDICVLRHFPSFSGLFKFFRIVFPSCRYAVRQQCPFQVLIPFAAIAPESSYVRSKEKYDLANIVHLQEAKKIFT